MRFHVLPPMARVRGTHVWLPRPDGFIDTPQFPGLGDPSSGAVLMVLELPGPYSPEELSRWPTAEQVESRRLQPLSREPLRMGVHEGMLLHFEQAQWGNLYDKWQVIFGDARGSVMVVSSCRAELAPELSSMLRTLVVAARWVPDAEQPDSPPFLLDAPSGFQPAQRILHGMIFTEDGQVPGPGSEAPILSVMPMSIPVEPTPREFSELFQEHQRLPGVVEVEFESAEPVIVGGMRGYELVAYGKDRNTGRALVIYQLLLAVSHGGFVLVQGRANAAARDALLPRMRSAARSVRRRK